MASALRSALTLSFVFGALALGVPGCSQQGEGERCDSAKNGSADCETALTCVLASQLLDTSSDRCCPAAGTESDKRCTRRGGSSNGTAGSAGTAGSDNAAGNDSGGGSGGSSGGTDSAGATSSAGAAGTPEEAAAGAAGGAG